MSKPVFIYADHCFISFLNNFESSAENENLEVKEGHYAKLNDTIYGAFRNNCNLLIIIGKYNIIFVFIRYH